MTSEQRKRYNEARAAHRQNRENLVVATEHSAAVVPLVVAIPAAINQLAFAIDDWQPGTAAAPITYTKDQDVRMYGGTPRKCTQTHTHHGEPNWDPDHYTAAWMEYHGTTVETARPWIKPGHAEDRYRYDEYMIWTDGTIQRCIAPDGTVYSPTEYPAHWALAQGEADPTDPDGGDQPTESVGSRANPIPYDAAAQPVAVSSGLYYSYKGKVYLAKADMPSCVWPPDTAIWQWELVA